MRDKKKRGGGRENGGKADTKHGRYRNIQYCQPSTSLYEQGRTWRQRVDRAYTQTPPFPVVFPDLCVCVRVCVYARLLLSLHHDFEYAWLDVLPRRCCSKNSTVIFDFRRGEKIFYFFSTDSSSRWCTTWTSRRTDERKREVVQHRSRSIRRSPAWHNFEFYATCWDSSNNVLMDPRKSFNPLIFVSWKICKVWEDTVQTRKSISPFDVFYGKQSDNIIVRVHLWFRKRR